jgi:(R,R)-butanediol dehydrogenase / meso-butanediol dehydrogenase / diacetyl reductase
MRAATYYGPDDLRVEDVPEPGAPAAGQVTIRVARNGLCGTDVSEWKHGPHFAPLVTPHPWSGHVGPTILGHEFVGEVVALGSGVEDVELGTRLVSGAGVSCGTCSWCRQGRTNMCARYYTLGLHTHGGLAELVNVPISTCEIVPDGLEDDIAVLAQPFAVAMHAVRRARPAPGERWLVVGAGGIGAFVVAAAAAQGAGTVLASDLDAGRREVAELLGATQTFDGRDATVRDQVLELTSGEGVDVVVEATGSTPGLEASLSMVRRGGKVLLVGLHDAPRELDLFDLAMRELEVITTMAHVCQDDLPEALRVLGSRDLRPVLGGVIGLTEVVDAGLQPLADGRAGGKILVDPGR